MAVARRCGGGVYVLYAPDFNVIGGSFTGNTGAIGGGIGLYRSVGSIKDTTVSGNVATIDGGGIWEGGAMSAITLQIAKVTGNTAPTGPNVYGTFM